MKLSIILPLRNEAKGIINNLNLITNSMGEINYEIIVVNDFSDDETYNIIINQKGIDSKIKLFNNRLILQH